MQSDEARALAIAFEILLAHLVLHAGRLDEDSAAQVLELAVDTARADLGEDSEGVKLLLRLRKDWPGLLAVVQRIREQ